MENLGENEWSYYILGYILGDGSIRDRGKEILISSKDWNPLHHMADFIGAVPRLDVPRSPGHYVNGGYVKNSYLWTIDVCNPDLYTWLYDRGIRQAKSKCGCDVYVPFKFYGPFLRGLLDSDGSVGIYRYNSGGPRRSCTIYGHPSYLYPIYCDLSMWVGCQFKRHRGDLYKIVMFSKESIQDMYSILYEGATIYMPRKEESFRECL